MLRVRFVKRISIAVVSVWLLSGCTPSVTPSVSESAQAATSMSAYYNQKVTWTACGDRLFCGAVKVPLDWSHHNTKSISLAAVYHKATGDAPLGTIIMNPGGPGASGYDWIKDSADMFGTAKLRAAYNILGFDPRGVGRSMPVACLNAKATDEFLYGDSGYPVGSAKDLAASIVSMKKFVAACQRNTGSSLKYVDTVSTAKDLDVLRAVMGDQKLNYLGYSYGTQIGATYAALFPKRTGHLVLDGAIDPTVADETQSINQLKGFDSALRAYLNKCLKTSDCPFTGTVDDGLVSIKKFLRGLELNPIQTSNGRELTVWAAQTGMIMTLYSDSYWQYLSQAFTEAFGGDGTTFLELADFYNDRDSSGKYTTNLMEANIAISCLDSRADSSMSAMKAQNRRMIAASPTLGRYWQYGALSCSLWPYGVVKHPSSYSAKGSAPIVVIGTTGDPATPYSQAVSLATKVLDNGYLVTFNGEGHTAYGRSNACVDDAVDNFFINSTVPTVDPNC